MHLDTCDGLNSCQTPQLRSQPYFMDTTLDPQQQPPSGHARQGAPPARARWQRGTWPVRADDPRVGHRDDQPRLAAEALRLLTYDLGEQALAGRLSRYTKILDVNANRSGSSQLCLAGFLASSSVVLHRHPSSPSAHHRSIMIYVKEGSGAAVIIDTKLEPPSFRPSPRLPVSPGPESPLLNVPSEILRLIIGSLPRSSSHTLSSSDEELDH